MQWWNAETIHRRSEGWNVKWLLECVVTCWLIWFQQYGQQYRISVQQRIMYSALHRASQCQRWQSFSFLEKLQSTGRVIETPSCIFAFVSVDLSKSWKGFLFSSNHKKLKKIIAKSNHEGAHEMGVSLLLPQFFHAFCTNCSYNTFINQLLSCLPRAPENNPFWS